MNIKNEDKIIRIIKYAPPILAIIISILLSISLYLNNEVNFKNQEKFIEQEYIKNNKEIIKSQVDRIYHLIQKEQHSTENNLKTSLKNRVNEAYSIAMNIYNENKELDNNILKKMISDALREIRFNNKRGYFFIYNFDHECILLPLAKELEGTSFYNYQDANGAYVIRNIIDIVKTQKEGFYQWKYYKPSDKKKQYKKLGFNKHFEPFNWVIGTGEYIEDFENDQKAKILNFISDLKYPNNGYIFALDYNGNYLTHIKKDIIGLNSLEAKDTRTNQTIIDAINTSKNNGSGYITYIQNKKPGIDMPMKKTSYVRGFDKWDMLIGKGFYEDDVKQRVEKEKNLLKEKFHEDLEQIFLITIIFSLVLLILSINLSRVLKNKFDSYKKEINDKLEYITKQNETLAHQSKMAAIGSMINNIAHQWRQPLSMILSTSTGIELKKEIGVLSDDDFKKSIKHINDATRYLSNTIEDFRTYFSKNKEKIEFSIKDVIEATLNIVNPQLIYKNIIVKNNTKDFQTYGLKNELIQVVINLINNAKDELEKIDQEEKYIFIDSYIENQEIILTILDNAGGVPKEIIEHIFEPYFTTKHQSQGTGIGLYMTEEIITKHLNGSIDIKNHEYYYNDKKFLGAKVTIKLILV
ncbi:cache domain-containing protein [Arcobacter arenosus]|jgi:signal transduction histidine kinase|uniref:histidine kinase n=1 Tax=Arcobacter arenosus TaxID=2576037 RepID=A0A5R8XXZ7_9BACT|nr:cache domain-containing protein [Arcobacter arenosus]TLP35733.1 GHKL domain-containing protein [Arcobacter arenosus]